MHVLVNLLKRHLPSLIMRRIAPTRSCRGLAIEKVVVHRVAVSRNKLDRLNHVAESKLFLESHVGVVKIDRTGIVVGVSPEDFDLSKVVVASPVVRSVSDDHTVSGKNTVSSRDDVLGSTDGASAHVRAGLTE